MTIDKYWKKLEKCGWTEYLSEAEKKEFHSQLRKNLKSKTEKELAFLALVQWCFEPLSLTNPAIIRSLAKFKPKLFHPTQIKETKAGRDRVKVSFLHNDEKYETTFNLGDEIEILDLANQVLQNTKVKERFIVLPAVDEWVNLVFVPTDVYEAAVREKLIPKQEDLIDMDEYE